MNVARVIAPVQISLSRCAAENKTRIPQPAAEAFRCVLGLVRSYNCGAAGSLTIQETGWTLAWLLSGATGVLENFSYGVRGPPQSNQTIL
jgi:hypothetical protein